MHLKSISEAQMTTTQDEKQQYYISLWQSIRTGERSILENSNIIKLKNAFFFLFAPLFQNELL